MKSRTLNVAFGKTLAKLRKGRQLTQETLSFESGLARNYISMLERGQRSPTLTSLDKLAKALHVGIEDMIRQTLEGLDDGAGGH